MNYKIHNALFIIGTRKSGTTSLYDLLKKHSKYSTSAFKETQFFTLPKEIIQNNIQWYLAQFEHPNNILEASTLYYIFNKSLENIYEFVDNPKFIIIIRDPAKRAYSSYNHMIKKNKKYEKRNFNYILRNIQKSDLKEIINQEQYHNKIAAKQKLINSNYADKNYLKKEFKLPFNFAYPKNLWPYNYLTESIYSQKIPILENKYKNSICVLKFEKLIKCKEEEMIKLQNFLHNQINLNFCNNFPKLNKTVFNNKNLIQKIIAQITFSDGNRQKKSKISNSKIDAETYNYLRYLLEEEYRFWFNRDEDLINYWKYNI